MLEAILDALIDSIKLLPFLFLAFLLIEYIEHKLTNKNKELIKKSGKFGPFIGSILGVFPQCGFSTAATNLYATRIISLGTLISIYLSTSDEMLPILISHKVELGLILKILGIKIIIGMLCGFVIDYLLRNRNKNSNNTIHEFCEEDHCHCEHGIIKSSLKHTFEIFIFILIVSLILNIILNYLGEEFLGKMFLKGSLFGPFIASIIGLIPNCAASVAITELYLNNAITFGAMIAGLLTGSGIGILVLFRTNKDIKENLKILTMVYVIGVVSGLILDFISIL